MCVFEPKFPKFRTSKWIFFRFFSDVTNFANTKKIICPVLQVCKVSANLKNLFCSGGRSGAHDHDQNVRKFLYKLFRTHEWNSNTTRARLAGVEFQHSTCKTSWGGIFRLVDHAAHFFIRKILYKLFRNHEKKACYQRGI